MCARSRRRALRLAGGALGILALLATAGCSAVRICTPKEAAARHDNLRKESGQRIAGYCLVDTPYLPFDGVVRAVGADSLELRGACPPSVFSEFNTGTRGDGPDRVLRFARSEVVLLGVVEPQVLLNILLITVGLTFPATVLFYPFKFD